MFEVKKDLSIANIFEKVDEYSIFRAYCHPFKDIDVAFCSELREDPVASCRITYYRGRLWYKDFGNGKKAIDCFGYIMEKYTVNFLQALGMVNLDFNIGLKSYKEFRPSLNLIGFEDKIELKERKDIIIKIKYRKWYKRDVVYWKNTYGIEKSTLELYQVKPIEYFFLDEKFIAGSKLSYAYLIAIENQINHYKIYSPYSEYKWINNCKSHHYQGYNQLPESGDTLIITKSLKDVMVLYQFGYSSIAPQSEAQLVDKDFMKTLKKRFNRIIMFFDNDGPGINGAMKNCDKYKLEMITVPLDYCAKDISDVIEMYGTDVGKELMKQLIQ